MSKKSTKKTDAIDWAKPALTQGVTNAQDAYADAKPIQQGVTGTLGKVFTGYGDSLVDYNRRRVVLSVGLSLVDF